MALSEALATLTERERAIFNAGMSAGAAQQLQQIAEQHYAFVNAAGAQAASRAQQAAKILATLPTASAAAGAELGRRVVEAGKALLGKR